MPRNDPSPLSSWIDAWQECRTALVGTIRNLGFAAADERGIRREDARERPHIGILRDHRSSGIDAFFKTPVADWIGTAYFPFESTRRIVIEVFGERNMPDANKIAWQLRCATGADIIARLADPCPRPESEDIVHTSNVENWNTPY